MLKQHNQLMLSFLVLADALAVTCAWLASYWLRFKYLPIDPTKGMPAIQEAFLPMLPFVVLAHLIIFWRVGLYRPRRVNSLWSEVRDILKALVVAVVAVIVIDYAFPQSHKTSRRFIATYAVMGATSFVLFRMSARLLLRTLRERGYNRRRAAIIGSGRSAQRLLLALQRNRWTGIDVAYFVDDHRRERPGHLRDIPVYGPFSELGRLTDEEPIDAVFIALPAEQAHLTNTLLEQLETTMADVRIVPEMNPFYTMRPNVGELDGVPILSLRQSPLYGWNAMVKRGFDVVVGSICLLIAGLPMLVIAAAVKLTSPGPVFYRQRRFGLDGQRFDLIKFRTMRQNAERESGAVWAQADDPRRTAVGALLRRTSLDELPNLFNVLAGHLSLVGPRPERPEFISQFKHEIPRYMLRHKIKAGMTGYAQVRGHRGQQGSLRKRIQHDLHYIEHWSLLLDIRILLQTVFGVWFSRHET
ncbi:MAG: undecaprenyl-phosphate glucose phosphotransferase [Phycisphaerae bacterium]|nr:undecaprenyl-phosphate glucose phosphotransferase [Phycisphaerae bacterium]